MKTGPPTLPRSTSESEGKPTYQIFLLVKPKGILMKTSLDLVITVQGKTDCLAAWETDHLVGSK